MQTSKMKTFWGRFIVLLINIELYIKMIIAHIYFVVFNYNKNMINTIFCWFVFPRLSLYVVQAVVGLAL